MKTTSSRSADERRDGGVRWTRRSWIKTAAMAGILSSDVTFGGAVGGTGRRYHVSLSPTVVEKEPRLLEIVREAGVSSVWLGGYFYGHEPYSLELLRSARRQVERAGLEPCLVNVPLGHPGDSLGAKDGAFPLTPPGHWRSARRPDGKVFVGTSLHKPATAENVAALKRLRSVGFRAAFLDDDFRLARGPGEIGGCYCDEHRRRFLARAGYAPARWDELLDDVRQRRLTPLLKRWLQFTCDELTASFVAQQRAFGGDLGPMVMYLGAEKAGIRLEDYRSEPFRVGELMFNDAAFGPVKGKTDELFSVLFHRRFVAPVRAYSETTAFPADGLSARHLAAKLVISSLADVRNTMFMSGLTPFPVEYWSLLGPAMRTQRDVHSQVAGHKLRGPFKHFWGESERCVGEDKPFSLWLALGVPFEAIPEPGSEGWMFLSDYDARDLASARFGKRPTLVCCPGAVGRPPGASVVTESMPELFAFKRRIIDQLASVPHVVEEEPAVCAWYPTARRVIVWNLAEAARTLTVRWGSRDMTIGLGALEAGVVHLPPRAS